jgi:hypothetical protein
MKKTLAVLAAICLLLSLCACGEASTPPAQATEAQATQTAQATPLDLTGEWKQVNNSSKDSYQAATISGDTIEVYWIDTDTQSLYWAGTYVAPESSGQSYSWDSVNDKDKTSSALLASGDDTKTFTYNDGQISYSVTAMGMTQTVKLEKQSGPAEITSPEEATPSLEAITGSGTAGSGTTGNYDVSIKTCTPTKGENGKPAVVITYEWTNNSKDANSFDMCLSPEVFQNGIQCDPGALADDGDFDFSNDMRDIQPGVSLEVQIPYILQDATTPIEVTVCDPFTLNSNTISQTFNIAQ